MIDQDQTTEVRQNDRRSFLGIVSGLIGAGISAVLAVTIGRYATAPAFITSDSEQWMDLGPLGEIPDGKLTKRSLTISRQSGWGEYITKKSVWVVKNGEKISVFSGTCPHLGCAISARTEKFVCACHGSEWGAEGNTVAGPTPRGMDLLDHRVEGNSLKVKYQDFKQGISAKEVVG